MKKKVINGFLAVFIGLLVISMLFGQNSTSSSVENQLSNFDAEINSSAVINDGNAENDVKVKSEYNKLSKVNASISIQIENAINKVIKLVNQILKKIVS